MPLRRHRVTVEEVPAPDQHGNYATSVRVLLADPPAFTPWYDHELASALAKAGADLTLATSRFRFGEAPTPDGYKRQERFYPATSRIFRRSPLRLPLKAVEHLGVLAELAAARPDVLHLQWLALPQLDATLRFRAPAVFTAHDLLPRRTAGRIDLWQKLLRKFDAVVVHTEHGRRTLAELGVDAHVIAHPVYPSAAQRADDGHTLLALGMIRPYKGLLDAIEVTRRLPGTKLLVAGDPAMPIAHLRSAERVEWRLGYLSATELDRALSEATVAVFPYRAELDQSGALLQALGAGVPVVVYDVAGLGEPVRAYGAGAVVPAGDVDAFTEAVRTLLLDPAALERARAGANRAREELTWAAAAEQHLALYRTLV
jgi:glycosyltransferase involved in cell wall biosynthesis